MLHRLSAESKLVEGAFLRGHTEREWCDPEIRGTIRRRSLARLRQEVEPVEPAVLARLVTRWQGVTPGERRSGLDALLDVVEKLQGLPLPASALERDVLPARVEGYLPGDLDALAAAGEIVWWGVSPLGNLDGRLTLFLTDSLARLHQARDPQAACSTGASRRSRLPPKQRRLFLRRHPRGDRGRLSHRTVDTLWGLSGSASSPTTPFSRCGPSPAGAAARVGGDADASGHLTGAPTGAFRSRRAAPAAGEGRGRW